MINIQAGDPLVLIMTGSAVVTVSEVHEDKFKIEGWGVTGKWHSKELLYCLSEKDLNWYNIHENNPLSYFSPITHMPYDERKNVVCVELSNL